MEEKFLNIYGAVFVDHSDKSIVIRTNNRHIDEQRAEEIMQDYVDEHRDEFHGKKVNNVMQYAINRFKGDVI